MSYSLVALEEFPKTLSTSIEYNLIEVFKVCNQMEKICNDNKGVSLSAFQIGLPWNLFVINRNNSYDYYLNCSYQGLGGFTNSIEGCLSIRNKNEQTRRFEVKRHSEVIVTGQRLIVENNLFFENFSVKEEGFYSIVFQHEIDHSQGILIQDIGKEVYFS